MTLSEMNEKVRGQASTTPLAPDRSYRVPFVVISPSLP